VNFHPIRRACPFLIILIFATATSRAAEVSTLFGYTANVEGEYSEEANNLLVLGKGAILTIPPGDRVLEHELTAHGDQVQVTLDEDGVTQATGLFALVRVSEDGTKTHIPGKLTATRMKVNPQPDMALTYVKDPTLEPQDQNWVSESEGVFRLKGLTSVERIHPPTDQLPEVLISMSGKQEQAIASLAGGLRGSGG